MPRQQHGGMTLQASPPSGRLAGPPALAGRPQPQPGAIEAPRLEVHWARHADELRQAQRLRHQVFVGEMGAQLQCPAGTPPGLDADAFDDHCEHLLVRTAETDHQRATVVGTYRVLTPDAARRTGGLYTDREFDLGALDALRPRIAELGRSCTHPDWRAGGVVLMLWAALAEFMQHNGLDITVGCASVPLRDGGHAAASLWCQLRAQHLAPLPWRASPYLPLPVDELRQDLAVEPPPLIKGYLKCGGRLLGPPAWDPDFGTADLPMMMDLADLPAAYRRRFLRA